MKKLKNFLKTWDGLWTIPISIFAFIAVGYIIVAIFGPEAGMMVPAYLQRLFYASLVMVFINFCIWLGIYINFPTIFNYSDQDEKEENFSKDFKALPPDKKIKYTFILYFIYYALFAIILLCV